MSSTSSFDDQYEKAEGGVGRISILVVVPALAHDGFPLPDLTVEVAGREFVISARAEVERDDLILRLSGPAGLVYRLSAAVKADEDDAMEYASSDVIGREDQYDLLVPRHVLMSCAVQPPNGPPVTFVHLDLKVVNRGEEVKRLQEAPSGQTERERKDAPDFTGLLREIRAARTVLDSLHGRCAGYGNQLDDKDTLPPPPPPPPPTVQDRYFHLPCGADVMASWSSVGCSKGKRPTLVACSDSSEATSDNPLEASTSFTGLFEDTFRPSLSNMPRLNQPIGELAEVFAVSEKTPGSTKAILARIKEKRKKGQQGGIGFKAFPDVNLRKSESSENGTLRHKSIVRSGGEDFIDGKASALVGILEENQELEPFTAVAVGHKIESSRVEAGVIVRQTTFAERTLVLQGPVPHHHMVQEGCSKKRQRTKTYMKRSDEDCWRVALKERSNFLAKHADSAVFAVSERVTLVHFGGKEIPSRRGREMLFRFHPERLRGANRKALAEKLGVDITGLDLVMEHEKIEGKKAD